MSETPNLYEVKLGKPMANSPQGYAAFVAKQLRTKKPERTTMENWYQGDWAQIDREAIKNKRGQEINVSGESWLAVDCGSTGCVAGHVAIAGGAKLLVDERTVRSSSAVYTESYGEPSGVTVSTATCLTKNGIESIPDYAGELLGLNSATERSILFSPNNSLADVLDMLDTLAEGKTIYDSKAVIHKDYHENNFDENCPFCLPPNEDFEEAMEINGDIDKDL